MRTIKALVLLASAAAAPLSAQTSNAPAATAAPTAAPAGSTVTAGATVFDTKGGTVGTVDSVSNGVAVINTGTNKAGLPVSSFANGPNGPVLGMTKAELDTAAAQASAQAADALKAQLAPGASVYGSGGATLGTVKEVDDQYVTLNRGSAVVKLPRAAFSKGDSGAMLGMTAEQLDAAVSAATTPAK